MLQLIIEAAGPFGFTEAQHPFMSGGESDPVPTPGGLDAKGDREMGLPGAWRHSDRLQQLRSILPTEVRVIRATHPLFGQVLEATSFKRWRDVLHLVVTLPDGSPGTVPAESTNVFGPEEGDSVATVLSAEGFRHLYEVVGILAAAKNRDRRQRRK